MTAALFDTLRVGELSFRNRVFMAPMTRSRAPEHKPGPLTVRYYEQRASAGLIFAEASQISPQGIGSVDTPGIHTEEQVAAWRKVTEIVHEQGGLIFCQLWHQGRTSHPWFLNGATPVAPSAIAIDGQVFTKEGPKPFVTPRALAREEIPGIVADYARAAAQARAAGFDGVELHCANGYLPMQFLEDGSNHRTDEYGGGVENRVRFPLEIIDVISEVWPANRVSVRISPQGTYNGMHDSNPATLYEHFAEELSRRGVGFLHLVEPVSGLAALPQERMLGSMLRARFKGAMILNGGFDGSTAQRALAEGRGDAISFGVAFLANPDLPRRLRDGHPLNPPDRQTFYGGDERGYTDYPAMT